MSENYSKPDAAQECSEQIREGDRLFRARQFVDAIAAYESAAESSEIPSGDLCAKLARVLVETGRPGDACDWALRVVDAPPSFSAWSAAAKIIERCGANSIPRIRRKLRVGMVGTWTTNSFVPLFKLAAARAGIFAEVYEAPFDQYFNETLDAGSPLFAAKPEALVLCPDHHAMGVSLFSDDAEAAVEAGSIGGRLFGRPLATLLRWRLCNTTSRCRVPMDLDTSVPDSTARAEAWPPRSTNVWPSVPEVKMWEW